MILTLVKKKIPLISLKQHAERRNNILIKRRCGGFGDILMQRMIFEDAKTQYPDLNFTLACPYGYMEMAKNHPFMQVEDINSIDENIYGIKYDITTACRVHESKYADNKIHRSDIWANHFGLHLSNHNMHLKPLESHLTACKRQIEEINPSKKPTVLIAAKSTNDPFGIGKSLTQQQIIEVVYTLQQYGFLVYTIHNEKQPIYDQLNVHQFINVHQQDWISLVDLADFVISVDTATFHIAGGLKKPLLGIFTYTDGKVYGKYYDFVLVQKHKDNGDWDCGPCFNCFYCPKSKEPIKPCLTEISSSQILQGFSEVLKRYSDAKNNQKNTQNICTHQIT